MASEVSEAVAAMILERRAARETAHRQHASTMTQLRQTIAERRAAGLKQRHARKLARRPA